MIIFFILINRRKCTPLLAVFALVPVRDGDELIYKFTDKY